MKTFIATVEVEFTCIDEPMCRERILGIPFGDSDCGFRIVGIKEGSLPEGDNECLKPEYRGIHMPEPPPEPTFEPLTEDDPWFEADFTFLMGCSTRELKIQAKNEEDAFARCEAAIDKHGYINHEKFRELGGDHSRESWDTRPDTAFDYQIEDVTQIEES
jgi:hypothetical protein